MDSLVIYDSTFTTPNNIQWYLSTIHIQLSLTHETDHSQLPWPNNYQKSFPPKYRHTPQTHDNGYHHKLSLQPTTWTQTSRIPIHQKNDHPPPPEKTMPRWMAEHPTNCSQKQFLQKHYNQTKTQNTSNSPTPPPLQDMTPNGQPSHTRCDPEVFRRVVLKEYCALHLAADTVTT